MKKSLVLGLALTLLSFHSYAEADERDGLVGNWLGTLNVQGTKLRIALNVEKKGAGFKASVDSLDQGVKGLAVQKLSCEKGLVKFSMNTIFSRYQGTLQNSGQLIKGVWIQGGRSFPLNLKKQTKKAVLRRPQLPKKPYPYQSLEVEFSHKPGQGVAQTFLPQGTRGQGDRVTLSGTLTIPKGKGPFPAVVLVSGSGPNDRDETLMMHKPFLVLSDYLTRRGIAVLRYDDRGVYKSTGNHNTATSKDFAEDAVAAIHFLKTRGELNQKQLGIIGHSEGGMIAPMAAVDCADIAFIVLLAGPGVNGIEVLRLQSQLLTKAEGASPELLKRRKVQTDAIYAVAGNKTMSISEKRTRLISIMRKSFQSLPKEAQDSYPNPEETFKMQAGRLLSPWFQFFFTYEP
ncbi:MAG: alpha/beta hydrolase, partial [Planctomycetota bacterium]|nr:alpha/beta hydrolase [Planctomycetota bacterium]